MIYKKYFLRDLSEKFKDSDAYFEFFSMYLEDYKKEYPRPGLLVLPGGGYSYCSAREAEPIALRFVTEGFNCFVLNYTCKTPYPVPQEEVVFVMDYAKKHREEFNLLDINLSLIGFSAAGHLAGSVSIKYKELAKNLGVDEKNAKPFANILGYAVLTSEEGTSHQRTFLNITGGDTELAKALSIEKFVTEDFPPTYIFTTETDQVVPYKNSELLVEEMKKHHVPYKYHLFPVGIHGGSLYSRGVYHEYTEREKVAEPNSIWVKEACDFIFNLIYKD